MIPTVLVSATGANRRGRIVYRDEDAFRGTDRGLGVLEVLRLTGLFDSVQLSSSADLAGFTTSDARSATVIPRLAAPQLDGSQEVSVRRVEYLLVLQCLDGDDAEAWRELDRMESASSRALLDRFNRRYGGFCIPWMSAVRRDEFVSRRTPARRRVMTGSFGYQTNLRHGVGR